MKTRSRVAAPSYRVEGPPQGNTPADASPGTAVASAAGDRAGTRRLDMLATLAPLAILLVWGVALLVLHHQLRSYSYRDLRVALGAIPAGRLAAALALTALEYVLVLPVYDVLALRYIAAPMRSARSWMPSFVAFALSQNLGVAAVSGGSVRYRFWSSWGIGSADIARGVVFTMASVWLGALVIAGGTLGVSPHPETLAPPLRSGVVRLAAVAALALVVVYLAWVSWRRPLRARWLAIAPPRPPLAAGQLIVSLVDWIVAAAALYVLIPAAARPSVMPFLAAFVVAQGVGIASHVPGGLGVFESGMLALVGPVIGAHALVPALVAYRAIYYLLPLGVAIAGLGGYEFVQRRAPLARAWQVASGWAGVAGTAAPHVLSLATFAAGAVLLVSGATPALHGRLRVLDDLIALGVIEVSHFAGSVAGMMLVLLAVGIRRRLDAAYHATVVVLGLGVAASLLKGLDYEEALFLFVVLLAFIPARAQFYRPAALLTQRLSPGWIAAIGAVVVGIAWLAVFSYKHVDYSSDLWWQFALRADAPRTLRAMVGVMGLLAVVGAMHLMSPPRVRPATGTPRDVERARLVARRTSSASANLALLGDKALLFDASGESFVMYGVRGRTWIALGDPIGPASARRELAWRFVEQADQHGGRAVFYAVTPACLPIYVDLGLMLFKIGEEARVPLSGFSLDTPERKWMRRVLRAAERERLSFELLPAERVPDVIRAMRRISDAWLADKSTREKGFTLGRFDEAYLRSFPVAVVRRGDDMLAFANVWESDAREELSVDLMRQAPDAPRGVMDLLFIRLMLWGAAEGYRWFSLGMAPLSGIEPRAIGPLWNRVSALVYRHGEHFYNFQGIRLYKEKFDPVWEPRYLASPGGLALPRVVLDVTALVAGGFAGVVRK